MWVDVGQRGERWWMMEMDVGSRDRNSGSWERPFYIFTKHAIERFKERFQGKFREVDFGSKDSIRKKMLELLLEARENKSFRNNHRFMDHVYQKYGYDNVFKFMCNGGVTFVIIPKPGIGRENIVTCFDGTHDRVVNRHKKFKKKKKSQEKNLIDLDMAMGFGWNIGLGHERKPEGIGDGC